MKTKSGLLLLILIFTTCVVSANDEKFIQAMKKNIQAVYEAREIPEFQEAVNAFERIASVEKGRWEPLYYVAYGNVMMANFEKDGSRKDAFLDAAAAAVDKAKQLARNESELFALEGFIHMIRVTVDPASRGMTYSPRAMSAFGKALELNSSNPRALSLMAQMQYGTAKFFNGPVEEACSTNAKALASFDIEKPASPISPVWGRQMAENMKQKMCQ